MSDILFGNGPAFIGGSHINVPTAPIKAFVQEVGAVQHPTSQELFDKMFRHQVETERQIEAAFTYVGSLGLVATVPKDLLDELRKNRSEKENNVESGSSDKGEQTNNANGTVEESGGDEAAAAARYDARRTSSSLSAVVESRPIPTSSTPLQHIHFSHITLLEENLLATRAALAHLYDVHGEHRTPMVTNTVSMKKASERLTEARRIAMARGLVRRMNDDIDVKGNVQIVGEVSKVDVGRIEAEREEILKLMTDVKKRHEAFLNS